MDLLASITTSDQGTLLLYGLLILLTLIELVVIVLGIRSEWYLSLNRNDQPSIYFTALIWFAAYVLSIIGYLVLRRTVSINDNFFATLFILGTLLNILWAVLLFYSRNIRLSTWLMVFIFLYQLLVVTVVAHLSPLAAILNIPVLLAYAYLLYLMIRLLMANDLSL